MLFIVWVLFKNQILQIFITAWLLTYWVGIEHLQGWRLHSVLGQPCGPRSSPKLPPNDLLLERSKDGSHGAFLPYAWMKAPRQQRVRGGDFLTVLCHCCKSVSPRLGNNYLVKPKSRPAIVFKLALSHWVLFPCEEYLRAWDRVSNSPKVMGEVHAKGKNSLF